MACPSHAPTTHGLENEFVSRYWSTRACSPLIMTQAGRYRSQMGRTQQYYRTTNYLLGPEGSLGLLSSLQSILPTSLSLRALTAIISSMDLERISGCLKSSNHIWLWVSPDLLLLTEHMLTGAVPCGVCPQSFYQSA